MKQQVNSAWVVVLALLAGMDMAVLVNQEKNSFAGILTMMEVVLNFDLSTAQDLHVAAVFVHTVLDCYIS